MTSEASLRSAIQGLVDGTLITLLAGGYLLFVRDGLLRRWFRGLDFWADLTVSSVIVFALFLVGRAVGQVATSLAPARFLMSFSDRHLLYAAPFFAVVAVTINFILQMNRMIGVNVPGYFVAGTYHRPRVEERIFLFLDLEGSTQLAEQLGSARYFELLRRFVDDLTEPVLEAEGQISGDEVVITWSIAAGVRAANCIRCFFEIRGAVTRGAVRYARDFGVVPRFRGGLSGGAVTAGELGDLRQQIVFVGDILNRLLRGKAERVAAYGVASPQGQRGIDNAGHRDRHRGQRQESERPQGTRRRRIERQVPQVARHRPLALGTPAAPHQEDLEAGSTSGKYS